MKNTKQTRPEQINTKYSSSKDNHGTRRNYTKFLSDDSHANDSSGTSVISSLKKKIGDK